MAKGKMTMRHTKIAPNMYHVKLVCDTLIEHIESIRCALLERKWVEDARINQSDHETLIVTCNHKAQWHTEAIGSVVRMIGRNPPTEPLRPTAASYAKPLKQPPAPDLLSDLPVLSAGIYGKHIPDVAIPNVILAILARGNMVEVDIDGNTYRIYP